MRSSVGWRGLNHSSIQLRDCYQPVLFWSMLTQKYIENYNVRGKNETVDHESVGDVSRLVLIGL